ncbi:ABC transporter substrate-binding protein [Mumia sp. ZJ1417]|uniref:ABC transporter substrate-binding protein n=1 Tax=Mumia sp. ZJ1417 TaxID=2708082 RepID=UPI0015F88E2D|nr:ABC transporter substrate-binding protein [Mumia sp. ZJ1417]QMW66303.1 ABC transporter substrate-binding protein [Mumia sp. ZJ1417]
MSGIVSLLPAATDIVLALALGDDLVAVTHECDERARTGRQVVVRAGHTRSVLDVDALAGLDPALILTQDLCAVCAVPAGDVDLALARLGSDAAVVTLDPHSLADVLVGIAEVAQCAGVPQRGEALVAQLRSRLADVCLAVEGRERPRVAVVEWTDPLYLAGHWIPDMVALAGGICAAGHPGAPSHPTGWKTLRTARPDIVVVAPCGYDLDGAAKQAEEVAARVAEMVGPVPVWAIDADALIVRPGPRLVDGVEALASVLHAGAVAEHAGVRRVA